MGINSNIPDSIYNLPRHLRPTLYHDGEITKPVRCAGVLPFIRRDTGEIYVLLQCKKENGIFEDFGGRVDFNDTTLTESAARECAEESNGILDKKTVQKEISEDFSHYSRSGKFCLFFVQIAPIHPSAFGDMENHDGIPRTCHWIKLSAVRLYNLHPRLRYSLWDKTLQKLLAEN